jgi:tetratricopeptide (TPR) repeat protein
MSEIREIRERGKQAYAKDEFEQAVELYEALWKSTNIPDKWDGWNYARTLRKLKRTHEALEVCQAVHEIDSDFEHNNNEYGWCIYQLHIRKSDEEIKVDEDSFFHAAEIILSISSQTQYSAYEKTIFRVLKYLKPNKKQRNIARKILEWSSRLNPDILSTEVEIYERDAETDEGASPREKWFSIRSAALYELEDYQNCIEVCQQAMDSFERLHYGNQHWFRMRIANSKGHLGQILDAIAELQNLVRYKPEWFIFQDLALWHHKIGQLDDAYKCAVQAAQSHRKHDKLENKWQLFLLMGQILQSKGSIEPARTHAALAHKLRSEQQWGIPKELSTIMHELEVDINSLPSSDLLYHQLKTEWELDSPRLRGTIKTVKSDKEFGYVLGSDNNHYHFKFREFKSKKQNLREGLSVTFLTQASFDRTKNRPSVVAIDIRVAQN